MCNLQFSCLKGWCIRIVVIGHCGGSYLWILCVCFLCDCWYHMFLFILCRWDVVVNGIFLKAPPPRLVCRKYIIRGDKNRKQDILLCCQAIFLPLSFHRRSRLRQPFLLDTTSAPGLHKKGTEQEADSPFLPSNLFLKK